MSNHQDDLYSFNGPKAEHNLSSVEGPDPSVNYNDFRSIEKSSVQHQDTLFILTDAQKCPAKWRGRLLAFKGPNLIWSFRNITSVWIENNELWASSYPSGKYKLNAETGSVLDSSFDHWQM